MTSEPSHEHPVSFAQGDPPRERSEAWARLRRYWVVLRAYRAIGTLERARGAKDLVPRALFVLSFLLYFWIGWDLEGRGAFAANNHFFNADCARAIGDILPGPGYIPSEVVALGHPLLAILIDPAAAVIRFVLQEPGDLPVRVLCHAAAAMAAALSYLVFRTLGAPRWLAVAGASAYGLSCSQLVMGSIAETFAFVSLALTASVLVALSSTNPFGNALVQVTAFGINAALAPHAVLAAPLLWLPRMRFRRWLGNTVAFVAALGVATLGLARLQELVYPGVGYFFQKNGPEAYRRWASLPATKAAIVHRATVLVTHFFAFSIVAPRPLLTGPPDTMTTFMWEEKNRLAHYDAFGSVVVAIWCALVLVATFSNVRAFFRSDGTARARIAFLSGWLLGTLGLFWYFGDDLLLYSPLWTFHWVMWVVLGLVPLARATDHRAPWFRIGGLTFVAMLALNNAVFVKRMVLQH